jgi:DNA-binding SARP family transcriptional activator
MLKEKSEGKFPPTFKLTPGWVDDKIPVKRNDRWSRWLRCRMPHTFQYRLHLLGSFRIDTPLGSIHLPTHKIESLLAYLVLHPESQSREKLAVLLWGDSTDDQARTSLRTALAALRKELGDDILIADRETIQLNSKDSLWVDAREFQRLVTENPAPAIDLYVGDLMPNFYADWILQERERLRTLYLDALLRLAQEARAQSQYTLAIEMANRVLAVEHTNEKAHQHLIFCYLATGNRTAALKQYEDCQSILRDELEVEPSPETTSLYLRAGRNS